MRRYVFVPGIATLWVVLFTCVVTPAAKGQTNGYERRFGESEATVKKILQQMHAEMSGRLPVLDGFAVASSHPSEQYERAYFQATVQVSPSGNGGSVVRISAKVTAWYEDPQKAHSGYELLQSNGRIETDILDQLSEHLASARPRPNQPNAEQQPTQVARSEPKESNSQTAPALEAKAATPDLKAAHPVEPEISAPQPRIFDAPSALSSPLAHGLSASDRETPAKADPERSRLQAEIEQMQDILKNQAHPKNLAAIKKSGTAVVSTPSLTAKPMFLATAHDEFEILNYNQDWVHVRISGLSRGWIWRNDLELPDSIPDRPDAASSGAANIFHVVREDTSPFPGDWPALRGKTVKLLSVQKIDDSAKEGGPQEKLEFTKIIFQKTYAEIAKKPGEFAGIVLIFDSADGGMVAADQDTLAKWKDGNLSDSAFWRSCFFDPPETFTVSSNSGGQ